MVKREIGKFLSYVLERDDTVVVLGRWEAHASVLAKLGFEQNTETKEWVGTGANLYGMTPGEFYDLFSGGEGKPPQLTAQATDGKEAYQVDGLPVVEQDEAGRDFIAEITAVDLETRAIIDEGVTNFRVG